MSVSEDVILSILVVSHNQKNVISRCLDSLVNQRINGRFEIVVSDDNSTDGTIGIIKSYTSKFSNIRYYTINSDDYDPTIPSERSAVNKANAYMHASGKYVVNVDGDDYLLSDDIYAKQIALLENNPECSLCMQNMTRISDNNPAKVWYWRNNGLKTGDKLDFSAYIRGRYMISNPAFMMRRDLWLKPFELYGKLFNDEYITMHHLQNGNIVYLDRADYMYVQYQHSVDMSYSGDSRLARYALLPFIYCKYFPAHETDFLIGYRNAIITNFKEILSKDKLEISEQVRSFLSQFNGFMFSYLAGDVRKQKISATWRVKTILYFALFLNKFNVSNKHLLHFLRILAEKDHDWQSRFIE